MDYSKLYPRNLPVSSSSCSQTWEVTDIADSGEQVEFFQKMRKWANPNSNVLVYEEHETTGVLFRMPSSEKTLEKATDRAECALPKNCSILKEYLSYSPIWERRSWSEPSFSEGFWEESGFSGGIQSYFFQTFNWLGPEVGNSDSVMRF